MADRPIECSGCKKEISCHYTTIDLEYKSTISACAACPIVEKHLYSGALPLFEKGERTSNTSLCCGQCGTTLESVRLGNPLGCPECYDIFSDILFSEIQKASKISNSQETPLLHIGRTPGESTQANPALRLIALNDALSDTLSREDYEQAAWLRDQIKVLSEKEMGHDDKI